MFRFVSVLFCVLFVLDAIAMDVGSTKLIRDVMNVERTVQTRLKEVPSDVTRVLLLGATGSGKSTLLHSLANRQLVSFSEHGILKLKASDPIDGFAIGHSADSETTIPGVLYDESNSLIYCDCPGFFDNRKDTQEVGTQKLVNSQEIVNAFAINQLIEKPSKVKVLLVISAQEIVAARGDRAKAQIDMLETLILPISELENSTALVITKAYGDVFQYLSELAATKQEIRPLLRFFLNNPSRVFSFPAPRSEDCGGAFDLFVDKVRLCRFLRDTSSVAVNPIHRVVLSRESLVDMFEIIDKFGRIKPLLREFSNRLSRKYKQCELPDLRDWFDVISRLLADIPASPEDFCKKVPMIIRDVDEYADILSQIEKFQPLRNFLDRIFSSAIALGSLDEATVSQIKAHERFQSIFADVSSCLRHSLGECVEELQMLICVREKQEAALAESSKKHEEEMMQIMASARALEQKVEEAHADSERKEKEKQKLQNEFEKRQKKAEEEFKKAMDEQKQRSEQQIHDLQNSFESERARRSREIYDLERQLERESRLSHDLQSTAEKLNEAERKLATIRDKVCYDCRYEVDRIIKGDDGCNVM